MDILSVIGLVLGSSALTTLIGALFSKKKTDAEIKDSYADRLERRIGVLEGRVDVLEIGKSITMSAINCAYACEKRGNDKFCPVLEHIEHNPLPKTANSSIND